MVKTVKKKYIPKQGDIILLDFNPQKGHEQKGKRPALVVSTDLFNEKTNFALVCPITNKDNRFPLHIILPDSISTSGFVLTEHVRSIDFTAREISFLECIPSDFMEYILSVLESFYHS